MSERTDRVYVTPEAKVLKKLREKHGYSMKKAGEALGFSDSYISQIENGRTNLPKGEKLFKFLELYGDIKPKYFYQLCKEWKDETSDADYIAEVVYKLKASQLKLVRSMVDEMLRGKA